MRKPHVTEALDAASQTGTYLKITDIFGYIRSMIDEQETRRDDLMIENRS